MTTAKRLFSSPWGPVQSQTVFADGIILVTTAGHGGLWLSPERQARMPESCRQTPYSSGGWYEEDCDALLPFYRFYEDCAAQLGAVSKDMIAGMLRSNVRYYTERRLQDLGVS